MSNESKIVSELRNKIEKYLRQKDLSYEVKSGTYWVRQGSTVVLVSPTKWGEQEQTLVALAAPVSLEMKTVSAKLTRFLVEENKQLLFGKFSLDSQNNGVWYEHVLLGDDLDAEEFVTSLVTIALTADKYDEKVCKMTGGKRFVDV